MKILITGAAGFIGSHVAMNLSVDNEVIGIDSFNNHYDNKIKYERAKSLMATCNVKVLPANVCNYGELFQAINFFNPEIIIHLAARAGVRDSITDPWSYVDDNITGFLNILKCSEKYGVKKILYASSSSVYGDNDFCDELHDCNNPKSFYAITKKTNEMMAKLFSDNNKIPMVGMRFFTVYGPWGRPDMSVFKFMKAILNNEEIELYNNGNHKRHFTYINDIVDGINHLVNGKITGHKIVNLNCEHFYKLTDLLHEIESVSGLKFKHKKIPIQTGDVLGAPAISKTMKNEYGFSAETSLDVGIKATWDWFKKHNTKNI